jgi:hypothetical protein
MEQPKAQADIHDGLLSTQVSEVSHPVTITAQGHGSVAQVTAQAV